MIGDTDFFIDLMHEGLDRHEAAVAKGRDLEARGVRIAMTAVTRFELAAGVARLLRPEAEERRTIELLRQVRTYALDGDSADRGGALFASLSVRGRPIGMADAMIAGIALTRGESVLTRNIREFRRVEGLPLATY